MAEWRTIQYFPYCACGCGRRVKRLTVIRNGVRMPVRYYERACVPPSPAAAVGWQKATTDRRRRKFHRELKMLSGRNITQEELLAAFQAIDARSYKNGDAVGYRRGLKVGQERAARQEPAA